MTLALTLLGGCRLLQDEPPPKSGHAGGVSVTVLRPSPDVWVYEFDTPAEVRDLSIQACWTLTCRMEVGAPWTVSQSDDALLTLHTPVPAPSPRLSLVCSEGVVDDFVFVHNPTSELVFRVAGPCSKP